MLLLFANCKGGEKENNNGMTRFEEVMTNEDSVAVTNLIDQFFSALENEQVNAAVSMLYKTDNADPYAEPQPLGNEEMDSLCFLFTSIPVYEHRIDYIKFHESILNEVKCTAVISPAQDNHPAATMSYYFKPINSMGSWLLCLMNTNTGDRPFVRNADKDSLTRHYQEVTQKPQQQEQVAE